MLSAECLDRLKSSNENKCWVLITLINWSPEYKILATQPENLMHKPKNIE